MKKETIEAKIKDLLARREQLIAEANAAAGAIQAYQEMLNEIISQEKELALLEEKNLLFEKEIELKAEMEKVDSVIDKTVEKWSSYRLNGQPYEPKSE